MPPTQAAKITTRTKIDRFIPARFSLLLPEKMLYRKVRLLFWISLAAPSGNNSIFDVRQAGYKKRPPLAGRPSTF
jgi:hypothetical protein